ncbi:hypothetical protein TUM17387_04560 [Shewanella carassii]|uniref:hypothetical protein n=1 Tax=Shewanella carassii TaxID=1987584 RepID=UPI001BEDFC26|nr:hypothetical protein [Shewanella carassii]BCV65097.1 hypothetical protein TUM17387_04560 [Shewanella carassii]
MKKLLLLAAIFSVNVSAAKIDDLIQSFEMSNVYAADWYKKGNSHIAESSNQYRDIKINLTDTKGAITVVLAPTQQLDVISIMPCYKLTAFIDYNKAQTWNDPETADEKIIRSVFSEHLKDGEAKEAVLNGWKLRMLRLSNKFSCEVSRQ